MDELRLTDHFVERFNERYFGGFQIADKNLLKRYMEKVMKPYQYRHLLRRMRFNDPQYIHFGSDHYLIVRNNAVITIYNRNGKY